jgi:hypothetical protein
VWYAPARMRQNGRVVPPVSRGLPKEAWDEQWAGYAQRIEAHLGRVTQELDALRQTLREAGIPVRLQRIRIGPGSYSRGQALDHLRACAPQTLGPSGLAQAMGCSPEYAFDLLDALRAEGLVERPRRGHYRLAPTPVPVTLDG